MPERVVAPDHSVRRLLQELERQGLLEVLDWDAGEGPFGRECLIEVTPLGRGRQRMGGALV